MQSPPAAQNTGAPLPPSQGTISGKILTEEFGEKIQVDDLTYYECLIAFKRGVTFRWIRDVDNTSYKIILQDQHFDQ